MRLLKSILPICFIFSAPTKFLSVGALLPIGKFVAIKGMVSYSQTLQTNIKCDAGEENAKAYIYLASSHANSGDATLFDFGIIRLGYNGGHVTKHQILKNGDSLKIDFLNKDGYVCIKNGDTKTFVSIFG